MKKRLVTLLLAGCMIFSMTACGSKEDISNDTSVNNTESSTESESSEHVHTSNSKLTKLGEYKGITYIPMDTTVTDEEVETEVQSMLLSSYTKDMKEVATETSVVNIDFVGKKDGVAFDGGTAEGYELDLGNSNFIEGFAESIIGMKVGETKDCPMTFPEDYGVEELNGAEVVFTITVNECWEKLPAELNDDFAVSNGYKNVDDLYTKVKEAITSSKEQQALYDKEAQLVEKLLTSSEFNIDDAEVEHYVSDTKAEYEYYASYYGYDLETYVSLATGMTMEEFEEICKENTLYSIKVTLVKEEIEKVENLVVSDELYDEKATVYASQYGYETIEALEEDYTKETIIEQITYDLVLDFIVENAVAEVKSE